MGDRKTPFNKLSHAQAERLALLSEELGECQQAIGKILRHGYESGWNGSNNRYDLTKELAHVAYAGRLLVECGDVRQALITELFEDKALNIVRFLHHQEKKILRKIEP